MKKITVFKILCFTLVINVSADKFVSVKFARCIDGDTAAFILNDEEIRVRFLAIDTPEIYPKNNIKPFGIEASDYTCTKITRAKVIKLEYDPKSDLKDRYGRYLAISANILSIFAHTTRNTAQPYFKSSHTRKKNFPDCRLLWLSATELAVAFSLSTIAYRNS